MTVLDRDLNDNPGLTVTQKDQAEIIKRSPQNLNTELAGPRMH